MPATEPGEARTLLVAPPAREPVNALIVATIGPGAAVEEAAMPRPVTMIGSMFNVSESRILTVSMLPLTEADAPSDPGDLAVDGAPVKVMAVVDPALSVSVTSNDPGPRPIAATLASLKDRVSVVPDEPPRAIVPTPVTVTLPNAGWAAVGWGVGVVEQAARAIAANSQIRFTASLYAHPFGTTGCAPESACVIASQPSPRAPRVRAASSSGDRRMSAAPHDRAMDDQRLGALLRAIRIRRRLRQSDVAAGAAVDRSWVSRIERGHVRDASIGRLRAIAGVLEVGLEIVPSWRGGDVARVVNERHSRMHELFAAHLARTPGWEFATEVSFSSWGERGVIDILAWHAARRVLLVIELKTEIPDPAGLIAQVGRYRRLAPGIGRERGWNATSVATWVLLAESDMNRRQLARHRVMLRNAFPLDGRPLRRWLRDPGSAGSLGSQRAGFPRQCRPSNH